MWIANKYAYYGGKTMPQQLIKHSGTITRKSKAGFQLDNQNVWYNRGFDYQGDDFDTLSVGKVVSFEANERNFVSKFSGNGSIAQPVQSSSSNGQSIPSTQAVHSDSSVNENSIAVAYIVGQPLTERLIALTKTRKEAVKTASELGTVLENYLDKGNDSWSEVLKELE